MTKWRMVKRLQESAYDKGTSHERIAFKLGYADGFSACDKATSGIVGGKSVPTDAKLELVYDLGYANGELDRG